jgi:hypothetical protein
MLAHMFEYLNPCLWICSGSFFLRVSKAVIMRHLDCKEGGKKRIYFTPQLHSSSEEVREGTQVGQEPGSRG